MAPLRDHMKPKEILPTGDYSSSQDSEKSDWPESTL
jgi:hypothetical protein